MTVLCSPCFITRDCRRPATNLDTCRSHPGAVVPMCDDCADEAGQAALERESAAYHGGSSWVDSAQVERAKRDGAMR